MKWLAGLWLLLAGQLTAQVDVNTFLPEFFDDMPYVRDLAITEDGKEMYFTVDDYRHTIGFIVHTKKKGKKWGHPEIASFSGKYRDIEPFLSKDGRRLYFASNRPVDDSGTDVKDYDIWYVERDDAKDSWSEPVWMGTSVNSEADEYYPSLTDNGDLYFTAQREGSVGKEDIFVAYFKDGKYQDPVSIPGQSNTEGYEFNAFVAPDASYLIYTAYRARDGRRMSDLYISWKNDSDEWGEGQLIPGIYSDAIDYCPFVDHGANRLYFTSDRNELPDHFHQAIDLDEFMDIIQQTPHGLGRIYYVDFDEVLKLLVESN